MGSVPQNVMGVWEVLNQIWELEKGSCYLKNAPDNTFN